MLGSMKRIRRYDLACVVAACLCAAIAIVSLAVGETLVPSKYCHHDCVITLSDNPHAFWWCEFIWLAITALLSFFSIRIRRRRIK